MGEMKYYDTARTLTALPASADWTGTEFNPNTTMDASAGSRTCLTAPAPGNSYEQRNGDKITAYKLKIKGAILCPAQANQTACDEPTVVRILLVQDMQTNATTMQGEDIMTSESNITAGHTAIHAFQNDANFGRFRVLKDKLITLQNPVITYDGTNVEQGGIVRTFKMNVNWKGGLPIRFNHTGTSYAHADVVDHSVSLIANAADIGLAPQITYQARFCYKDR